MLGYGGVLLSCLLAVVLFLTDSDGLRSPSEATQHLDPVALEVSGSPAQPGEEKSPSKPMGRLILLDQVVHVDSVIENKKKRAFTGGNTPLDRLSVSNMDVKVKKRKEVDSPRRRVTAPIDRIGAGRLPSSRG